ncbi:hypothetical protein [Variovorax gossypii]
MNVLVRRGGEHWVFFPQFLAAVDGVRQYQKVLTDDAFMFAGWLPYQLKRWDIASDKLAFKRHAESAGIAVPSYSSVRDTSLRGVIVKKARSSFGAQIRGPFGYPIDAPIDVASGEYYEQFVEGRLVKVWYWSEEPVCAELDRMPSVVGDGVSDIRTLILARADQTGVSKLAERDKILSLSTPLLRHFGKSMDSVLDKGVRQIVEFRYGSMLMQPTDRQVMRIDRASSQGWMAPLWPVGLRLVEAIPPESRPQTLFTVDAILDKEERLWMLEMNSNPTVHPLAYPAIVAGAMQSQQGHP